MEEGFIALGEKLRIAREKAGLEILDVEHRTRIPRNVLMALEEENFSVFSSPAYAKSFLAQYGVFLGVDLERWIEAFEPVPFIPEEMLHPFLEPVMTVRLIPMKEGKGGMNRATFWGVLLSIGLLAGAIYGYLAMDRKFSDLTKPPEEREEVEKTDAGTTGQKRNEDEVSRPPRAIIVRD